MKTPILIFALALLVMALCSCGQSEEPVSPALSAVLEEIQSEGSWAQRKHGTAYVEGDGLHIRLTSDKTIAEIKDMAQANPGVYEGLELDKELYKAHACRIYNEISGEMPVTIAEYSSDMQGIVTVRTTDGMEAFEEYSAFP